MKPCRCGPLAALLLLSACATQAPAPEMTAVARETPPAPVEEAAPAPPRRDPLKHLAGRDLQPMPAKPLTARAQCRFRDPTGYRGQLRLEVRSSEVRRFEANIDIPRQGRCDFRLADFRQTDASPAVVLSAKRGECTVSLWEQGRQVTVAFRDCRAACSGNAVEYLWPILVDSRTGRCS